MKLLFSDLNQVYFVFSDTNVLSSLQVPLSRLTVINQFNLIVNGNPILTTITKVINLNLIQTKPETLICLEKQ